MQVNLYLFGAKKVEFIQMIQGVGSNGIAVILLEEGMKMT